MEDNYIKIMIDSLKKKIEILDGIISKDEEESQLLSAEEMDWDQFDKCADAKSDLIDQIEETDRGFDALFDRVKDDLGSEAGKKKYAAEIKAMQSLIRSITEKSAMIQAQEVRNKRKVETRFAQSHQKIGQSRVSSRVARDYYKNMQQTQVVQAAFLDSKN